MVKISLKCASLIMACVLIFNIFLINVSAKGIDEFDSKQDIICIAHRGDWHSYPENSAEAVKAGFGYSAVSVDLKVTKDNKVVLMADDTTDRTVVDANGKAVSASVSDMTYDELTKLFLRAENGMGHKPATQFNVAGLDTVLTLVPEDSVLILNTTCADFEAVYQVVAQAKATDKVVFRFKTDSNSDIIKTTSGKKDITVFGNYQGNIIFLATSAVKNSLANGMNVIELGSKNANGVLYDSFLMDRFEENGKAMVSMVNGRSGKRPDNERGWDDLIKNGYSVIETDYPEQLCDYLDEIEEEKKQLLYYRDLYKATDLSAFTTDTENAFKQALNEAESLISRSSSLSELQNARHALQSAFDNLTVGEKKAVTLKFDITAGRVIAVVLCGGAIIAAQVFFFRKRDKNNKAK